MNKPIAYTSMLLLLLFVLLMPACSKEVRDTEQSKNGASTTTLVQNTSDTSSTSLNQTTTVTTVTAVTTTNTPESKPTASTTVVTTHDFNTLPTGKLTSDITIVEPSKSFTFSYNRSDYDVLKKIILETFPNEAHLDEFVISKQETNPDSLPQMAYDIRFHRIINGCYTDAVYTLLFDKTETCVSIQGRTVEYDPTKVVPPRVATDAEIEAAKKAEAEKVPEGFFVWEQKVSKSHYYIETDTNCFSVQTVYAHSQYYDDYVLETGKHYGDKPPCAAFSQQYVITR